VTNRTVVIIQARMTSTRLPGKVAMLLEGAPILQHVVERAKAIPGVDHVCVAAPEGHVHEPIVEMMARVSGVSVVRGPEHDVLRRYAVAAAATQADAIVRITSDCPMIDYKVSGAVIALAQTAGASLARTAHESGYPVGFDTEYLSADLLRIADREALDPYEREHVTPFLWRRPERFPSLYLDRDPDRHEWRLTVDTAADYTVAQDIYRRLYPINPLFGMEEIEPLLTKNPVVLTAGSRGQKSAAR
jgi:spore coat polysaccharide biosynthesis protein SpsF